MQILASKQPQTNTYHKPNALSVSYLLIGNML